MTMMKQRVRKQIEDVNTLNRRDLELFATKFVRHRFASDEILSFADSIQDQKLRKYFIKQLQKQMETKQSGSHKQASVRQTNPPRSAQFALLLIPKRNREHLIGDLEEEYRTIVLPQYGSFLAMCWYFEQVALTIGCYAWPTIRKALGLTFFLRLIGR